MWYILLNNFYHVIIEQVRSQSNQFLNLRKWRFEQVKVLLVFMSEELMLTRL
jgi:hypothetical protein